VVDEMVALATSRIIIATDDPRADVLVIVDHEAPLLVLMRIPAEVRVAKPTMTQVEEDNQAAPKMDEAPVDTVDHTPALIVAAVVGAAEGAGEGM